MHTKPPINPPAHSYSERTISDHEFIIANYLSTRLLPNSSSDSSLQSTGHRDHLVLIVSLQMQKLTQRVLRAELMQTAELVVTIEDRRASHDGHQDHIGGIEFAVLI